MLEGLNREITLPMARNWLRGIFFGSLAAEFYPEKKKESLFIALKTGKINAGELTEASSTTDTVHTMQPGETLGKIAKKYTGSVMNYKEIAEYNKIKNINSIKVGQEIKIPASLLQ
jgi:LysM repeat protein